MFLKIEPIIYNLPKKKAPSPDAFTVKSTIKEEMISILYNLFQKLKAEETHQNSFFEDSITVIPKPDEDITRKRSSRPISLMNMNVKILNRILANGIKQCTKRMIHHNQMEFIPGM